MNIKRCTKCFEMKDKKEFSPSGNKKKNGIPILRSWCRKCNSEQSAKWYKDLRDSNPEKTIYLRLKNRSKKLKLDFDLELSDIKIPKYCPVLDFELDPKAKTLDHTFNSITVDRVDNSKGYIKSNIQIISWRANKLKSDGTLTELEAIVAYMKRNRQEIENSLD